jgi:hypothetical protein
MKSLGINPPLTRAEFERNLHLLHRKIEDGKIHFAQGLSRVIDGLARVRFLPNGRIDFLSVDESARLQANMMNHFDDESYQAELAQDQCGSDSPAAQVDGDLPLADYEAKSD